MHVKHLADMDGSQYSVPNVCMLKFCYSTMAMPEILDHICL